MRKEKVYVIQGNYGHGWEDVYATTNKREARETLACYRENESVYTHRLVIRWEAFLME